MYRIIVLFLLVSFTGTAQTYVKEFFDTAGKSTSEEKSEYFVIGKKVLRVDEIN